jgi:hypothetical protein
MRPTSAERGRMLYWLVGNCDLFGLAIQNWVLVAAGAFALYIFSLLLMRQKHGRLP